MNAISIDKKYEHFSYKIVILLKKNGLSQWWGRCQINWKDATSSFQVFQRNKKSDSSYREMKVSS